MNLSELINDNPLEIIKKEVNEFAQIRLIVEAKFGDNPLLLVASKNYLLVIVKVFTGN